MFSVSHAQRIDDRDTGLAFSVRKEITDAERWRGHVCVSLRLYIPSLQIIDEILIYLIFGVSAEYCQDNLSLIFLKLFLTNKKACRFD
jgi:hypothetical protein